MATPETITRVSNLLLSQNANSKPAPAGWDELLEIKFGGIPDAELIAATERTLASWSSKWPANPTDVFEEWKAGKAIERRYADPPSHKCKACHGSGQVDVINRNFLKEFPSLSAAVAEFGPSEEEIEKRMEQLRPPTARGENEDRPLRVIGQTILYSLEQFGVMEDETREHLRSDWYGNGYAYWRRKNIELKSEGKSLGPLKATLLCNCDAAELKREDLAAFKEDQIAYCKEKRSGIEKHPPACQVLYDPAKHLTFWEFERGSVASDGQRNLDALAGFSYPVEKGEP